MKLPAVELSDAVAGLFSCKPGSAALLLSDLPSGETRAEFDRRPRLAKFWPAAWFALRSNGTCLLFASCLPFAADLISSQADAYRYDFVWNKTIATGFLNAAHRPLKNHEHILIFSRGRGVYHPQRSEGHGPISTNGGRGALGSENYGTGQALDGDGRPRGKARAGATDRFPRSVLSFGSLGVRDKRRRHPQQKPEDLLRYLVRTYSSPGDLVLDPFAGSGSTGRAALAEGRLFRGWDSDPRFGT
jgi:site-specific DNA-methyltransferase (adenine-specific)